MSSRDAHAAPRAPGEAHVWGHAAAVLALATAAILVLFADSVRTAWHVWTRSGDFGHCLLAIPIAAYLAYTRRAIVAHANPTPEFVLPLAGAALGGAAWLTGRAATIAAIEHAALALVLQSLLLAVLGRRVYAALRAPCLSLLLLVPAGDQLVPALQSFTTGFVATGLDVLGIPNHAAGHVVSVPGGEFHVAEACAGLRFLAATLAFAIVYADRLFVHRWQRAMFLAWSLALPVFANGLRALAIVAIAHWTDHRVAAGVDHLVYGWVFFLLVVLAVCAVGRRFAGPPGPWRPPASLLARPRAGVHPARAWLAAATVTAAAALGPLHADRLGPGDAVGTQGPVELGGIAAPGWHAAVPSPDWHPLFPGRDGEGRARFVDAAGRAVDLHVVFYAAQRDGAEIVGFANAVHDARWRRTAETAIAIAIDGDALEVACVHIARPGARRTVLVAYWVDGGIVGTRFDAKLAQAIGALASGRRAAAAILISAADDDDRACRTLADFARGAIGIKAALAARAGRPG